VRRVTFDAGPSVRTPQILAVLAKYHVHATFFRLGKNHVRVPPEMCTRRPRREVGPGPADGNRVGGLSPGRDMYSSGGGTSALPDDR